MSEVGVSGKAVGLYVVGSYRVSSMEYIFFWEKLATMPLTRIVSMVEYSHTPSSALTHVSYSFLFIFL